MVLTARCPTCGQTLDCTEAGVGASVRCPQCGDLFRTSKAVQQPPSSQQFLRADCVEQQAHAKASTSKARICALLVVLVFAVTSATLVLRKVLAPTIEPALPVDLPESNPHLPPEIAEAVTRARELNQGKLPEELEKALATFKDKTPAAFPPPPPNPRAEPTDIDHALSLLHDPLWIRRKGAAAWLARRPVEPAPRTKVNNALLAMLRDGEVLQHQSAADALFVWADANARTELVELAGKESVPGAPAALMLLARMKDPRAAPIAARQLGHFLKRSHAVRVLEVLGPVAEKDVASYLTADDLETRTQACRVLGRIGTEATIAELESAAGKDSRLSPAAQQAIDAIKARGKQ